MWDEIGELQFNFLSAQGLTPSDVFLDLACGSLRAGRLLIPYLDPGHYIGVEKEAVLIEEGLQHELSPEVVTEKRPVFLVNDSFDFSGFPLQPSVGIAQSLFTHLPPRMINTCMHRLREAVTPDCRFFVTYLVADQPVRNPSRPNAFNPFYYTQDQMRGYGEDNGWTFRFIGEWDHPRAQVMTEYVPARGT